MKKITPKEENSPIHLDVKDKKIINELFSNARASFSSIAKKIRVSKEVVHYRIKRLQEIGLVRRFNTVVNPQKLGFEMYFVYVLLKRADLKEEEHIFSLLEKHPNVSWLVRGVGSYNIVMKCFVRNQHALNQMMKDLELQIGPHIEEYEVDYLSEECPVSLSFLYANEKTKELSLAKKVTDGEAKILPVDIKILKAVAAHARKPIADIAKELCVGRELVSYRLKKLEREGVIIKYRPSIGKGVQNLGYNWYFVMLKLGRITEATKRKIDTFLLTNHHVSYFYRTVGNHDMHIEIKTMTTTKLNEILRDIRECLGGAIRQQELMVILEEHKYHYFPECLLKSKKKG